jgi:hypothetical protein
METTQSTFVPALIAPDLDSFAVRQAIAGFLAGYGETTREAAYGLDLRQWMRWCAHELGVFDIKRAHIELFARSLEQEGKARVNGGATPVHDCRVLPVLRRRAAVAGFSGDSRPATEGELRVERGRVGPQRTRYVVGPSRSLRRPGSRVGVSVGVERVPDL